MATGPQLGTAVEPSLVPLQRDAIPTAHEAVAILRLLRFQRGLNLAQFGRQIGVDPLMVWEWEHGRRLPSLELRKALVVVYGERRESHAATT